jgi:hypothetical protein
LILNAVEAEHSGVPFDPSNWRSDRRLYMPQMDNSSYPEEYRGVTKLWSLGHALLIAPNGAYLIQENDSERIVLEAPGEDGRPISAFKITQNEI